MPVKITKQSRRLRIKRGIRKRLSGSAERPRLTVFRSNTGMYAQLVNDATGKTICSVSTRDKDSDLRALRGVEAAAGVGRAIAEKAKAAGIAAVVFDRNGYLYHGRVKAVADAAREAGLEF